MAVSTLVLASRTLNTTPVTVMYTTAPPLTRSMVNVRGASRRAASTSSTAAAKRLLSIVK
jgi:hypothetical protein